MRAKEAALADAEQATSQLRAVADTARRGVGAFAEEVFEAGGAAEQAQCAGQTARANLHLQEHCRIRRRKIR